MRFLLDTHALIWWSENDVRLGSAVRARIADLDSDVLVSAVSMYEMQLKYRLGKLPSAERLVRDPTRYLSDQSFAALSLTYEHADLAGRLPLVHRDPFDRMLIAQALTEDLTIVSNETLFDQFGVRRLW